MFKQLAHTCFTVADLDVSEEFYCGNLGLKRAFEFHRENGERFGMYICAGSRTFIELFEAGADDAPRSPGRGFQHICLEVEDVQACVQELQSRGVEITGEKLGSDHSWQAWLKDPDGNRIELHSYTPESWQFPHL